MKRRALFKLGSAFSLIGPRKRRLVSGMTPFPFRAPGRVVGMVVHSNELHVSYIKSASIETVRLSPKPPYIWEPVPSASS